MTSVAILLVGIFSTLTLISNGIIVGLILLLAVRQLASKEKIAKKIHSLISQNYVTIVFVISAVATVGSLSFSEIAAFIPCKLCWYQRIAMYPIALVSLVSLIKNDNGVKKYIVPLAVVGALIAAYHILVQIFPQALECSDEVAKCSAVEFAQFGYITIPVMSLSAFLLIILVSTVDWLKNKK